MITRIRITPPKDNPIPPTVTRLTSWLMPSPARISPIGPPRIDPHQERAVRAGGSGALPGERPNTESDNADRPPTLA